MVLPKFEDVHPAFNGPNTYRVTNEEPELHTQLLRGHRLRKIASIASAGEIPISVLLPKCRQLDCIDHSYGSLAWTCLKAIMLAQNGPRQMKRLLCEDSFENFMAALREAEKLLPEGLQKRIQLGDGKNHNLGITVSDHVAWRKEWFHVTERALLLAHAKLHLMTLIHGDISDLKARGPYDCFYYSNAHEHADRVGKYPKGSVFGEILRDGGLIVGTAVANSTGFPPSDWETVKLIKGIRTTWGHQLLKKMPPPAPPPSFAPTAVLSGAIA